LRKNAKELIKYGKYDRIVFGILAPPARGIIVSVPVEGVAGIA